MQNIIIVHAKKCRNLGKCIVKVSGVHSDVKSNIHFVVTHTPGY